MGNPFTSKFVLFDEAQLDIPKAASLEELESGLYELISDELAPYDDMNDGPIELDWIASERLDASMSLQNYFGSNEPNRGTGWSNAFSRALSKCTGLPDALIKAYNTSGSTAEIKKWLTTSLETGASYRHGLDDIHKITLRSLGSSRIPGFDTGNCYYDSRAEGSCDARPEDFGDGKRIIVEMSVYWF